MAKADTAWHRALPSTKRTSRRSPVCPVSIIAPANTVASSLPFISARDAPIPRSRGHWVTDTAGQPGKGPACGRQLEAGVLPAGSTQGCSVWGWCGAPSDGGLWTTTNVTHVSWDRRDAGLREQPLSVGDFLAASHWPPLHRYTVLQRKSGRRPVCSGTRLSLSLTLHFSRLSPLLCLFCCSRQQSAPSRDCFLYSRSDCRCTPLGRGRWWIGSVASRGSS